MRGELCLDLMLAVAFGLKDVGPTECDREVGCVVHDEIRQ